MRIRAARIVVHKGALLVMLRRNVEGHEFYSIPGGGVETGESIEEACVREIDEECSVAVRPTKLFLELKRKDIDHHYYFLCDYLGGEPQLRVGTAEHRKHASGTEIYMPMWLHLDKIAEAVLYPESHKEAILALK